jgi:hypothetical protein
VAGIEHEPPRKPSSRRLDAEQSRRIVETTLHSSPKDATHWSTRSLARHLGLSHMSVARVWEANGLQPHRIKTFKLSRDKHFVEKLTDVVGLYLNPPDKALVFCVDEKSQIQDHSCPKQRFEKLNGEPRWREDGGDEKPKFLTGGSPPWTV